MKHEIQLLRERLDQQNQQTCAAVSHARLLQDQLAAESAARVEAQVIIIYIKYISNFSGNKSNNTVKSLWLSYLHSNNNNNIKIMIVDKNTSVTYTKQRTLGAYWCIGESFERTRTYFRDSCNNATTQYNWNWFFC